jgi:hypothetical protein
MMQEFDVYDEEPQDGRRGRFAVIFVADLVLRMVAARRAWKQKDRKWFVAFLIISSGGILPLSYLLYFSRRSGRTASSE